MRMVCALIIVLALATISVSKEIKPFLKPVFPENLSNDLTADNRIIKGQAAFPGQFSWQVHLLFTKATGSFQCGGSLIHPKWVLTAAHCVQDVFTFVVTLGSVTRATTEVNRVTVTTDRYFIHENYNSVTLNNDIGLVDLKIEIGKNDIITTIKLPLRGERVGDKIPLEVSGFGKTSDASQVASSYLMWTNLNSISNDACSLVFGSDVIVSSTICALGNSTESVCNGDSGGGLIIRDDHGHSTLIGVVSFVSNLGCGVGYPSGYVRTESYLDWIRNKTGIVF